MLTSLIQDTCSFSHVPFHGSLLKTPQSCALAAIMGGGCYCGAALLSFVGFSQVIWDP